MSTIKEVREMMGMENYFENFKEYNISIDDNKINFEIIKNKIENEYLDEDDYEEKIEELDLFEYDEGIAQVIAKDGYDITGFRITEYPTYGVVCFANYEKEESFDIIEFTDKWEYSYAVDTDKGFVSYPAKSIKEAIEKSAWQWKL